MVMPAQQRLQLSGGPEFASVAERGSLVVGEDPSHVEPRFGQDFPVVGHGGFRYLELERGPFGGWHRCFGYGGQGC